MKRHPGTHIASAGFTLLELVIMAAILVLVSAASFPAMTRFYEDQKLQQAAIELQSSLLLARSLALRNRSSCSLTLAGSSLSATLDATNVNQCPSFSTVNLSQLSGVRGLSISSSRVPANASCATSSTAPCTVEITAGGLVAGLPQTYHLSGNATSTQFCVDLRLTLLRVGSRSGSSGSCNYSRS